MCPLHIPITNECQKTKFQKNHIIALYIQSFLVVLATEEGVGLTPPFFYQKHHIKKPNFKKIT